MSQPSKVAKAVKYEASLEEPITKKALGTPSKAALMPWGSKVGNIYICILYVYIATHIYIICAYIYIYIMYIYFRPQRRYFFTYCDSKGWAS